MFIFLQNQGLGSIPLVFAIFVAAHFPGDALRLQDYLGALILLAGIAGEALADAQLKRFRDNPANKGRVCDVGLWRWSRHPNYFFEWFGWLAYPVIALSPVYRYPGAGRRCWRRSSCTGSWSTSPASRRWKRRCCARAASAIATTSRAPACSFRCRRKRSDQKRSGHMSFVSTIIGTAERVPLPDVIIRAAIQRLCSRTATRLASGNAESDAVFADEMAARAIAEYTDEANAQHYEVPAAFFAHVLGPNRKYSSCFYKEPASTLQEAEEEALRQTVEHADLADGQSILELGCGWGSLSLWMARQFPHAQVTAVSNSHSQREFIEGEAAKRGLKNLRVVTSDMNVFDPQEQFDRIVSVEMFEHMMNWRELMTRVRPG